MTYKKTINKAGPFSSWSDMTQKSISNGTKEKVPCVDCTVCCTSAFYILIRKNESQTIAQIPPEQLLEIPGVPEVHYLDFTSEGHCPFLIDNHCSIYDFRPYSFRTLDFRIYSATRIKLDKDETRPINIRIKEWKFSYPTIIDRNQQKRLT